MQKDPDFIWLPKLNFQISRKHTEWNAPFSRSLFILRSALENYRKESRRTEGERQVEMKTKRWIKFPEESERLSATGASSGVESYSRRGYSRWAGCFRWWKISPRWKLLLLSLCSENSLCRCILPGFHPLGRETFLKRPGRAMTRKRSSYPQVRFANARDTSAIKL